MLLPGITINTGPADFFPIEQLQLMQFDGQAYRLMDGVMSETSAIPPSRRVMIRRVRWECLILSVVETDRGDSASLARRSTWAGSETWPRPCPIAAPRSLRDRLALAAIARAQGSFGGVQVD
jgi:hypothetical protein